MRQDQFLPHFFFLEIVELLKQWLLRLLIWASALLFALSTGLCARSFFRSDYVKQELAGADEGLTLTRYSWHATASKGVLQFVWKTERYRAEDKEDFEDRGPLYHDPIAWKYSTSDPDDIEPAQHQFLGCGFSAWQADYGQYLDRG